jgi:hypothetical protein
MRALAPREVFPGISCYKAEQPAVPAVLCQGTAS